MYFFSNSELYLKYNSFHKKSRSINEASLKQSTFLFFSGFILHLYFFLGSSLKVYFYWTSMISRINEVYLKYTSYIVFSVGNILEMHGLATYLKQTCSMLIDKFKSYARIKNCI